jgi:group I intron endonuclease
MALIYVFEDMTNGKAYVGQTTQTFSQRMRKHLGDKQYIDRALRKRGVENFKITTMTCSEEYLDWMEREWIKEMNSLVPNGYNIESGGNKHKRLSMETRMKMSIARKGKPSKSHPAWNRGIAMSESTKRIVSQSRVGIVGPQRKVQCMETGEIFDSAKKAADFCGTDKRHIYRCCRGIRQTTAGFHWQYVGKVG